jgi:hypothetical protein
MGLGFLKTTLMAIVAATLSLSFPPKAALGQTPGIRHGGSTFLADLPPEVRLRRLHLVRPDLIPYPIDIEVYC